MEKIGIVIPTYNEAGNIEKLLSQIFSLALQLNVLIVDDNSPDGTGTLAEQLKKKYPGRLFVIRRTGKLGLGSAYSAGFQFMLQEIKPDLIMGMDADLSHDPNRIPIFVEKMREGYDVVVGSRYITGGGTQWTLRRRLMSKGANWLANLVLGLGVSDVTGAFRCYRTAVIENLLDKVDSKGYASLHEMLFHCVKHGFKIGEVPIIFTERKTGKSKLSFMEMLWFLRTLTRLRLSRFKK